jgi:hypothetical protein
MRGRWRLHWLGHEAICTIGMVVSQHQRDEMSLATSQLESIDVESVPRMCLLMTC